MRSPRSSLAALLVSLLALFVALVPATAKSASWEKFSDTVAASSEFVSQTIDAAKEGYFEYDGFASGDSLYNYFRDYDPSTGRYRQSDPIGIMGGINGYAYASDSPLRYRDPSGLSYKPPPRDPPVPGATIGKPKDGRKRWNLSGGGFCEWDSQHGEWEVYNKRGRHQGVRDTNWKPTKPAIKTRKATP